jgi:hypothetical protein
MAPPFHTIEYGPFKAGYHVDQVSSGFKEDLRAYLTRELLSQVTLGFEHSAGSLAAVYDEDRFCGPRSAVRDIYRLVFRFTKGETAEHIDQDLIYRSKDRSFSPRRGNRLYLWTVPRQNRREQDGQRLSEICNRILRGDHGRSQCPICQSDLSVTNEPRLLDVRCPNGCLAYNMHRDPRTGEPIHGHSILKEPE